MKRGKRGRIEERREERRMHWEWGGWEGLEEVWEVVRKKGERRRLAVVMGH